MTRRTEEWDREAWQAALEDLDADVAEQLHDELHAFVGGEICQRIEVVVDSLGRIDSRSSPRPVSEV